MVLSYTLSLCCFGLSWSFSHCLFLVLSFSSFGYVCSSFVSVHRLFPFPFAVRFRVHVLCLSELPNHYANRYQSPASVAAAIDDMADAIVTKAAQKAKEAIENAACHDPETKLQSALG